MRTRGNVSILLINQSIFTELEIIDYWNALCRIAGVNEHNGQWTTCMHQPHVCKNNAVCRTWMCWFGIHWNWRYQKGSVQILPIFSYRFTTVTIPWARFVHTIINLVVFPHFFVCQFHSVHVSIFANFFEVSRPLLWRASHSNVERKAIVEIWLR